ncbi:MAG: phosphocarrier protein HPr [Planctomycetota bacterium]|jgi:phosphocarrier protein HPr
MTITRQVVVSNAAGMHARPCHAVVSTAQGFKSTLKLRARGREVDGKSILHLMTLEASVDTEVELVADGEDADALLDKVALLFESGFGED